MSQANFDMVADDYAMLSVLPGGSAEPRCLLCRDRQPGMRGIFEPDAARQADLGGTPRHPVKVSYPICRNCLAKGPVAFVEIEDVIFRTFPGARA